MNENSQMPPKYLPIGTVCWLKDGQKSIMVTGFGAVNTAEKKIYDYMGVLYPEGQITSDITLMFDHAQIVKIDHMGLDNEENKVFQAELKAYMAKIGPDVFSEEAGLEIRENAINQTHGSGVQNAAPAQSAPVQPTPQPAAPAAPVTPVQPVAPAQPAARETRSG